MDWIYANPTHDTGRTVPVSEESGENSISDLISFDRPTESVVDSASDLRRGDDLDIRRPAEDESIESAAVGDLHFDGDPVRTRRVFGEAFDLILRVMEGAFGKDRGGDSVSAEAYFDRLAVDAVEAVSGQVIAEVPAGGPDESLACFAESLNVIDREGDDLFAAVIVADDFDGGSVGVEVDGVRVEFPFCCLAGVESVIAHEDALAFDGGIGQAFDVVRVRGKVLGRGDGGAEDI